MPKSITRDDSADLRRAKGLLEHPGLLIQAANLLGSPIESIISKRLPKRVTAVIERASTAAVSAAFDAAAVTMRKDKAGTPSRNWAHTALAIGAGAAGGFFGVAGLAIELPFTTATMLRSIADIARSQGEAPHEMATRLACIEVLALGGTSKGDDGAESGYFATRAALAQQVSAVTRHIASHGLAGRSSPAAVRLIQSVANRFSVPVTQKVLAEAVPIIGAVTGAALNGIFMAHFQRAAQGHFIVRRLERKYGAIVVKKAYDALEELPPSS
ncbi:MAG: EcsC family protein [Arenimonas sp.]